MGRDFTPFPRVGDQIDQATPPASVLRGRLAAELSLASERLLAGWPARHGGATPADRQQLTKGTFTVSSSERNIARPQ